MKFYAVAVVSAQPYAHSSAITIRYYRNEQYIDQINTLFEAPTVESLSDGSGDSGAQ